METVEIKDGINKEMEQSIKEKIIFAYKNITGQNEKANYIKKRMDDSNGGKWAVLIFDKDDEDLEFSFTWIEECYIKIKLKDQIYIVFKTNKE
ncbi:MAG: dynein light chain family protein [archaeon]|nr:dynein light chain family protein [archaeon]